MIGDPVPSQRAQVLADLNSRIDQFFASGGQPEQLPGPTFAPRPLRPIAADALTDAPQSTPKPGSGAELNLIRNMAKTMSFSEAVEASGIQRVRLIQLSKAHLIRFQVSSTERRARDATRLQREAEKAKLVELIKANSGIGLSRNFVARKLGISNCYLKCLIAEYAIDFPTWYARP